MKSNGYLILVMVVIFPVFAIAQNIEKLGVNGYYPQYVEGGKALIVSRQNKSSIEKVDLISKKHVVIADGQNIYHRCYIDNDVIYFANEETGIKSYNLKSNELKTCNKFKSCRIAATQQLISKKSKISVLDAVPGDMLKGIKLIFSDGSEKQIAPSGNGLYTWIALSPDRKKVIYAGPSGMQLYIVKNEKVIDIVPMEQPRWADNENIIYVKAEDDGYKLIKSDIMTYNIRTKENKNLTKNFDGIVLSPSATSGVKKVLFNTENGEIYELINK